MITKDFAAEFSQDWVDSWNSHDIARILSHYHEDFVMSSPKIAVITNEKSGVLHGKVKVAEYWTKALSLIPNLQFTLIKTFVGSDSIILYYQGVSGLATEVFFFNSEGVVIKAAANYE
jgi:SnoaL-like domain